MNFFRTFALMIVALIGTLDAQTGTESMTNYWHSNGAPHWTDDVPTAESSFGRVDQLNGIWWLEYGFSRTLNPGTYAARVRLKKIVGSGSRHPLTLTANVNGAPSSVVLPAADQTVDTWVWTPNLVFTVNHTQTAVSFFFGNTSGTLKAEYWFDAFEVVPVDASQTQSLTDWTHTGGSPNWTDDVPTSESSFGKVDQLNFVNDLDYASGSLVLPQPGTYAATVRFKKLTATGFGDLELSATVQGQSPETETTPASVQIVGQWAATSAVIFTTTVPNATVTFGLRSLGGAAKQDYWFDQLTVHLTTADRVALSLVGTPTVGATFGVDVSSPAHPGELFVLAFAFSNEPGVPVGIYTLPLASDSLFAYSLSAAGSSIFANNIGTLDGTGSASPMPTVTSPSIPALSGLTVYAAAMTANGGVITSSSDAFPITLQ